MFFGFNFRARAAQQQERRDVHGVHARDQPGGAEEDQRRGAPLAVHTFTPGTASSNSPDQINPVVRGWMTYYGRFTPAALMPLLKRINGYLVRWARKKYRRLAPFKRAKRWWDGLLARNRADAVLDAVLHCGLLHPPPPDQIDEELSDERLH